jgi:hypothetical protein
VFIAAAALVLLTLGLGWGISEIRVRRARLRGNAYTHVDIASVGHVPGMLENGWQWSDAIPADTSPPPDSSAINAWRRRAFPARQRGWGWEPDEPRWEGLAEARECARRVQDYHTDVRNAWYRLRDR